MMPPSHFLPISSIKQKTGIVLCGLLFSFILLEIALRLGGLFLLSLQEHQNLQALKQKGVYRIICLGDSMTQSQYPKFLQNILNEHRIGIHFSVIDQGRTNTSSTLTLNNLESCLDKYRPDLVVAMLGINDSEEHIPYKIDNTSASRPFLHSLKTYRLIRLLWLNILNRNKKTVSAQEEENHPIWQEPAPPFTEMALKEILTLNPSDAGAHIRLGGLYQNNLQFSQAEESFYKALAINPQDDRAYDALGWLYKTQGRLLQAEEAFRHAITLNPKNSNAYLGLGWLYKIQHNLPQAEKAFKQAATLDDKDDNIWIELGLLYRYQGNLIDAEAAFKEAIRLNPNNDRAYRAISLLYQETGRPKLSAKYARERQKLKLEYDTPATIHNYRRLKEVLDQRKIRLVCVQYPVRSITPLKTIFDKNDHIVFVDNAASFKIAIKESGLHSIFLDMFAGDFGHCTEKGNQLLANNIANAILKEIFKQ